MKVIRLAQLLELKYGFQSRAQVPNQDRILAEVRRDVSDAFRNYFSRSARDSMFQYLSDRGEPQATEIISKMNDMVAALDSLAPVVLMKSINEVLKLIYTMHHDPMKNARKAIEDSVPGSREAETNKRNRYLVKLERSINQSFPALQKAAIKLQQIAPEIAHGGHVSRRRGEIPKWKLLNFVQSGKSNRFGIANLDILREVTSEPGLNERFHTLFNAVDSGKEPLDGPAVRQFAQDVAQRMASKDKTNQEFFETNEPLPLPEKPEEEE